MKKLFTILSIVLLTLGLNAQNKVLNKNNGPASFQTNTTTTFTATQNNQAKVGQATIVLTAGDVWGDGTGYQILIDTDGTGADAYADFTCGASYADWELMIPTNATSDDSHVVANASQQITIPAGTYDYAILNPGCTAFGAIYTASDQCSPSVGDNYVFEAGKIYTFTATLLGTNDCITLVVTDMPTEATMSASNTELYFAGVIGAGATDAQTSIITAFNLTADITATTAAPFAVSSDGITFGTTATIPMAGGTVYVNYTPALTTPEMGTVVLTSTDAVDVVITLGGQGVDCSTVTLPLTQSFENLSYLCWTTIQGSPAPTNLLGAIQDTSHVTGTGAFAFSSYNENTVYDQYLISPELPTTATGLNYNFYYMDFMENGAETFKVGYSTTTNEVTSFTWGDEVSTPAADQSWFNYVGNAPTGTKFIAIHYYSDYMYYLIVDDITILDAGAAPLVSDLESLFMTSNADPTPIATTLAITDLEDVTVFPGIANIGPDAASTYATVIFTIDATEVLNQAIDVTNLPSGSFAPLTPSGQTITAADMNTMGLSGVFDVCMSVTYAGTDNNVDNNETCVTVTRTLVNVETNITSAISVFPNPANSVVTVANAENANIVILNMVGEVVANVENASANQTIDMSNLANGTYFVRVNAEVFKINLVK